MNPIIISKINNIIYSIEAIKTYLQSILLKISGAGYT
jgi:hypothetical protein